MPAIFLMNWGIKPPRLFYAYNFCPAKVFVIEVKKIT